MAFRIKQEKPAPELEHARAKLEEALQCIVEKAEESPCTSEDEYNKALGENIKKEPSPVSSPTKRPTQRAQRKRRRKDEGLNKNANSYIMKLFDRAVDLTPFTEQTPLYPICRAWINNQSLFKSSVQLKEEPAAEEGEGEAEVEKMPEDVNPDEVRQLPPPKPLEGKDLRIPSPIPQPEEEFVICSDGSNIASKEILMRKHLTRWKAVRKKWKNAAKLNEERYAESGAILKNMFEQAQCQADALPGITAENWEDHLIS